MTSLLPGTTLLALTILLAQSATPTEKSHRDLIEASTVKQKSEFHVVFEETIKSREQRDWKDAYSATVEVFRGEMPIGKFRASTLPNFIPSRGKPKDWKYAVVQATCAFPSDLKGRSFTWTRTKRADGKRPCLRLAKEVPIVNLSSERAGKLTLSDLLAMLKDESKANRYGRYAEDILVHSGQSQDWRGSAGCLTIHPDDADKLFELIPEGMKGTLELNRGIEDENAKASYCY